MKVSYDTTDVLTTLKVAMLAHRLELVEVVQEHPDRSIKTARFEGTLGQHIAFATAENYVCELDRFLELEKSEEAVD